MYRKAALLTMGKYIDSLQGNKITDNGSLMSLGESFLKEQLNRDLRCNDVNWLMFGKMWDKVLRYCVSHDITTNWIDVTSDFAKCKVRYIICSKLSDIEHESFMVQDASEYLNSFIQVESLISISRGAGLQLLNRIYKKFTDVPILINAGYLYYGDYECINESSECYNLLDKLVKYYETAGFKDVNKYIGNYEESCVMILCNDIIYDNIRVNKRIVGSTVNGFMDAISKM